MTVFAIRPKYTNEFYGFRRVTPNETKTSTSVVYFNKKKDAIHFASFLSKEKRLFSPQLYEYEDVGVVKGYVDDYMIYEMDENFMRLMLGMSGLGYHECEIRDGVVYCIDKGIIDVSPDVRADVFESLLD